MPLSISVIIIAKNEEHRIKECLESVYGWANEIIVVDDARLLVILDKMGKQRRDSIEQYQKASRQDLVSQEQFELDLIARYLPTALTAAEIAALIEQAMTASGALAVKDMGKVMQFLKPKCQGRADLTEISAIVKAHLLACSFAHDLLHERPAFTLPRAFVASGRRDYGVCRRGRRGCRWDNRERKNCDNGYQDGCQGRSMLGHRHC